MSTDSIKKRKPKVIRTDGGAVDGKRTRSDTEQEGRYYSEEAEVDLRDPNKDYALYKETCEDLQRLMAEIQDLKSKGSKDPAEIEARRIQSCVHFMTLKKLNRLAHIRLKKGRDRTHEAKQKVDAHHLQLQNLLYEVMHLQKEITKCLEFKSQHEEVELVSVEEFYREAPAEISNPQITIADSHQQTLARLDWELEQRKRLAEKYQESLASREKIVKEIEVKKEYLSSLQPRLNNIMQASLPVQEYLAMPFDQVHKQQETARHLPPPLYVLFVQATSYGQACDKKLTVSIEGDVDDAKALLKPPEECQAEEESDSEAEEEQTTKRRRPTLDVQLDDKRKEMLKSHPLSVCINLKCKDDSTLHLTFYFLINLNILTVKAKVFPVTELCQTLFAGDLLSSDTILSCLYPKDHGLKTPNPANRYQFDKVGILALTDYVGELGHPYLWVQKLGGLEFPRDQPQPVLPADNSLSASHMEMTMKLLKIRLQSRLALHRQFVSLEHGFVPVSSESQHLFPVKVVSRLVRWCVLTFEDYLALSYTKPVGEAGLAEATHLYYSFLIERGTAKLHGAVTLNPGYPAVPPIFSLWLFWKGERNASNDDNIRAMESEVNVHYSELYQPKSGYQLLTNQLQRLCVSLDVYLETETHDNSVEGPKEFPQEKMCLRLVRGPNRLKPFKFQHPQGFFSHR